MSSDPLAQFTIPGGNYQYTGVPINDITSLENTLVTGLLDESGSTRAFASEMEKGVKEIVKALRRSPRADNLMYRHCHFSTGFREVHGYQTLNQIDLTKYDGCYICGGQTHYFDNTDRVLKEMIDYAEKQSAAKYLCNGYLFMITDGMDYGSSLKLPDLKKSLARGITSEALESLNTLLIGVNNDDKVQEGLKNVAKECGFTQYLPLTDTDEKTIAKLCGFISKSIQAQSQALGSGGPSKSLTF